MHRDQRKQSDQALLAKGQTDQRNANHHVVAEGVPQGAGGGQCVEAKHQHGACKDDAGGQKVQHDGAEIQIAHLDGGHGAKQQRGCQHIEHQIGQIFDGRGPNPIGFCGDETQNNQQHHRRQGGQRRGLHVFTLLKYGRFQVLHVNHASFETAYGAKG